MPRPRPPLAKQSDPKPETVKPSEGQPAPTLRVETPASSPQVAAKDPGKDAAASAKPEVKPEAKPEVKPEAKPEVRTIDLGKPKPAAQAAEPKPGEAIRF
jgi:hypothetical protein